MKYFAITFTFLLLLSGCSDKNAYFYFKMSEDEELFESNTLNSKIESNSSVNGILSVTYLNNVDKNISKDEEHFLISLYMKDKNIPYSFKLNENDPIRVEKLEDKKWNKNSIVVFNKTSTDLNLTFYSDQSTSVLMNFSKER